MIKKLKVSVIGTVGIPACYGGFESLVENITKNSSEKIEYTVFCSTKNYTNRVESYNGAQLVYVPLDANGIQSIFYDIFSLMLSILRRSDVILVLGVSGCCFLPFIKLLTKTRIITNIDGLEWSRDKWGRFAKWFLKFSEAMAVRFSDVIITDNQAINEYVINSYGKDSAVIAYGGESVVFRGKDISALSLNNNEYYLSLCRIEPENNVEMILMAFANNGRKLKFVGNWDSSDYGKKLKSIYEDIDNIEIIDPIYDKTLLFDLRFNCIGYIHGHSAGGTNPSLVEIMHYSKPIYAYDCIFNRYTTENKAFYFSSPESLNQGLDSMTDTSLNDSAFHMREIAIRRYTWDVIKKQYESLFIN